MSIFWNLQRYISFCQINFEVLYLIQTDQFTIIEETASPHKSSPKF